MNLDLALKTDDTNLKMFSNHLKNIYLDQIGQQTLVECGGVLNCKTYLLDLPQYLSHFQKSL